MAFTHGKDSVFDNSGGSLTDISTYVNNMDFLKLQMYLKLQH